MMKIKTGAAHPLAGHCIRESKGARKLRSMSRPRRITMSPRFGFVLALAVACSTAGANAKVSVASEPSFLFLLDQPQSSERTATAEACAPKAEAETGSADNTKQEDRSHAKTQVAADCKALESAEPGTH